MFHMIHCNYATNMPKRTRPQNQRWVSYMRESPFNSRFTFNTGDFNFTVSYSKITDLRIPYAASRLITEGKQPLPQYSKRNSSVLWMVSHCKTQSHREDYVKELSKYINIDIVGKCGNMYACPRKFSKDCEEQLVTKYYFYLALENSICDDYITEKTWRRLTEGAVPIVLDGGMYAEELPKNSYIDVKDFASPQALAKHLEDVMASAEKYATYHAWRQTEEIYNSDKLCVICKYAYETKGKHQIIPDIRKIWNADRSCISPQHYYKGIFNYSESVQVKKVVFAL